MKNFRHLLIVILLSMAGCDKKEKSLQFELLLSSKTGITFNNTITETKDFNPLNYIYIYNGAGVGTGDINNDGLPDLFFAGNEVASKLYLNKGDMVFEDITEKAGIVKEGWATGINFIDINTDGYMDIYICMAHREAAKSENRLYVNQGDTTFKEEAAKYGLNDKGYSSQAAFFDYDGDGDLDMYLLTNAMESFNHNNIRPILRNREGKSTDRFYRNNGDTTFTNVSKEAGINTEGYGLGISILDVNKDGLPDVYCSNDFITNDLLWVNNGDGTFTDRITEYISQTSNNGMGMDIADFNNDGIMDMVQMDMLPESNFHNKNMTPAMNYNNQTIRYGKGYMPQYIRNTLQLGNDDNSFSEIGRLAGVHKTDWSWAPLLADLDNDGRKDLFLTNGYGRDITDQDFMNYSEGFKNRFGSESVREDRVYKDLIKLPSISLANYFFKNSGELSFENVTNTWSEAKPSMSNGAIYVDLDLDGDLDLVTNNINAEAFVYQNKAKDINADGANHIAVKLEGSKVNSMGIGAKVTVFYGDTLQTLNQYPVRGYVSSVDQVLHFGLGKRKEVDSIQIIWPDKSDETIRGIATNTRIIFKHSNAKRSKDMIALTQKTLVAPSDSLVSLIVHKENKYIDFQGQPLLLKMLSREGPGVAIGAINSDGRDAIFMSTALNDTSYVWVQGTDGIFSKGPLLPNSWKFEQQGSVMADFNGDGLLDLYVASGGNELPYEADYYQDQLYLQKANGTFEISSAVPALNSSTSTVNAADFDGDGDLDLFIGSRLKPNSYPLPDRSYLLENTNGSFKDITNSVAPEMKNLGMVTSALWTDFNNDDQIDLIVVGEWMEITFFENQKGTLKNVTSNTGVAGLTGFWNSINGGDFDQDGDIDYVLGNFGENTDLKASKDEPLTVIAKDFDNNGQMDPIMGYYVQGVNYPLPTRDALISQIAGMKKRYPLYTTYANATFDAVFETKDMQGAIRKEAVCLGSGYLENQGDGTFSFRPLPKIAQIAPVYGISIFDINSDGYLDVLLSGNRTDTETLGGSMNTGKGTVLLGDGDGGFVNAKTAMTGFSVPDEARGIAQIQLNGSSGFIVANNDGPLRYFSTQGPQRTIAIRPTETHAIITLSSGARYKQEFYFGSGYLTQDARQLIVPNTATEVLIYNAQKWVRNGLEEL